jgi:polysaccharide export outer membrane protein
MIQILKTIKHVVTIGVVVLAGLSMGCSTQRLETATYKSQAVPYVIGPGDSINVFVWGNPDLSSTVPVRPDGKITTPLVEDVQASGKTPTQLARDMEKRLAKYIKTPIVTVIVTGFVGRFNDQIRIIGEAAEPQSLPYRENMTLLDVMIAVGGLTEYADGNDAKLIRNYAGEKKQYDLRIDDLIRDGDISANVDVLPGDVIIIPESWF